MPTNKCSVLKRIYAFLIDFVLVLITSLVFEMACSVPLFNVCFSFQDKCNTLIVEQVKTGLFYVINKRKHYMMLKLLFIKKMIYIKVIFIFLL